MKAQQAEIDQLVSIHALLAECDAIFRYAVCSCCVSIHALLAECDVPPATLKKFITGFNPRTPCGVRPLNSEVKQPTSKVSIHALLAECDSLGDELDVMDAVSIHALLAECDSHRPRWAG